jgi:MscS family membrane protein
MKTNIAINRLATILLTIALLLTISGSQEELASEEDKPDETTSIVERSIEDITKNPLALPDTSSPQAALKSFLDNVNNAYSVLMAAHRKNMKEPGLFASKAVLQMEKQAEKLLDKSVYCLNLSDVPESSRQDAGYESTIKLKEILDRIKLPLSEDTLDAQSKETDEKQNKTPEKDNPDAQAIKIEEEQEKIPELEHWRLPETDIVISKVIKGPRKGEFLFTPQTVARIDRFYEKVQYLPYKTDALISIDFLDFYEGTPGGLLPPKWNRWIPVWSTAIYFNQTLWQWFALFVLPLAA